MGTIILPTIAFREAIQDVSFNMSAVRNTFCNIVSLRNTYCRLIYPLYRLPFRCADCGQYAGQVCPKEYEKMPLLFSPILTELIQFGTPKLPFT